MSTSIHTGHRVVADSCYPPFDISILGQLINTAWSWSLEVRVGLPRRNLHMPFRCVRNINGNKILRAPNKRPERRFLRSEKEKEKFYVLLIILSASARFD
jgi:hypothetical protein